MSENSLADLKEIAAFLRSTWGALSAIASLLAPLNSYFKFLPLASHGYTATLTTMDSDPGALLFLSPQLFGTAAIIMTCFFVFQTFSERDTIKKLQRAKIKVKAYRDFVIGFLALLAYLKFYFDSADSSFRFYYTHRRFLVPVYHDLLLLVLYSFSFAFMTRAFILLGLKEYVSRRHVA